VSGEGAGGEQRWWRASVLPLQAHRGPCRLCHPQNVYSGDGPPVGGLAPGFPGARRTQLLCAALGPPPCIPISALHTARRLCRTVDEATKIGYSVLPKRAGGLDPLCGWQCCSDQVPAVPCRQLRDPVLVLREEMPWDCSSVPPELCPVLISPDLFFLREKSSPGIRCKSRRPLMYIYYAWLECVCAFAHLAKQGASFVCCCE